LKNLLTTVRVLSEKEKGNYLTEKVNLNNTMNSFLYYYPLADKAFITGNYDLQLLFKSMVLSGTKNIISSIRESTVKSVRKIFEQWQLNKTTLAKQDALPIKQRKSDLVSIEDQTESLEKELSLKSSSFESQQQSLQRQMDGFYKAEKPALVLSMSRSGNDGTLFVQNGGPYAKDSTNYYAWVMLSSDDYLRIQRLVDAGQKVELEADVKTKFYDKDIKGYNVVAEIPGTDPVLKDEIVMLGGHLDSWQGATGATDNAAGCAVMM